MRPAWSMEFGRIESNRSIYNEQVVKDKIQKEAAECLIRDPLFMPWSMLLEA